MEKIGKEKKKNSQRQSMFLVRSICLAKGSETTEDKEDSYTVEL